METQFKEIVTINIYTDASVLNVDEMIDSKRLTSKEQIKSLKKKGNSSGFGFCIELTKTLIDSENKIRKDTSTLTQLSAKVSYSKDVNVIEICALARSMEYLEELIRKGYLKKADIINVYADNKNAVRRAQGEIKLSKYHNDYFVYKTFLDQFKRLKNQISKICPVELHWVKGHAICVGNQIADELAKSGRRMSSFEERIIEDLSLLTPEKTFEFEMIARLKERSGSLVSIEKEINSERIMLEDCLPKKFEKFRMTGTLKKA